MVSSARQFARAAWRQPACRAFALPAVSRKSQRVCRGRQEAASVAGGVRVAKGAHSAAFSSASGTSRASGERRNGNACQ